MSEINRRYQEYRREPAPIPTAVEHSDEKPMGYRDQVDNPRYHSRRDRDASYYSNGRRSPRRERASPSLRGSNRGQEHQGGGEERSRRGHSRERPRYEEYRNDDRYDSRHRSPARSRAVMESSIPTTPPKSGDAGRNGSTTPHSQYINRDAPGSRSGHHSIPPPPPMIEDQSASDEEELAIASRRHGERRDGGVSFGASNGEQRHRQGDAPLRSALRGSSPQPTSSSSIKNDRPMFYHESEESNILLPTQTYMTEEELDRYVATHHSLNLTKDEIDYLRVRRRRLSIERKLEGSNEEDDSVAPSSNVSGGGYTSTSHARAGYERQDESRGVPTTTHSPARESHPQHAPVRTQHQSHFSPVRAKSPVAQPQSYDNDNAYSSGIYASERTIDPDYTEPQSPFATDRSGDTPHSQRGLDPLSLRHEHTVFASSFSNDVDRPEVIKCMVLGSEHDSGKLPLLSLFLDPVGQKELDFPFHIQRKGVILTEDDDARQTRQANNNSEMTHIVELWAPDCARGLAREREELYAHTDVFVLVFSLESQQSLEDIRVIFEMEIERYLASCRRNVPIIVVANHSEARQDPTLRNDLVPTDYAVRMAKYLGATRYIEVASTSSSHATDIFVQAIRQHLRASHIPRGTSLIDITQDKQDAEKLRQEMTTRTPEGTFDLYTRKFVLTEQRGVSFVVVFNNSEFPAVLYSGPMTISRQHSRVKSLTVYAVERCRFKSRPQIFQLPKESPLPQGHFDIARARFVIHTTSDSRAVYYFTLDGSKPRPDTAHVYQGNGVPVVDSRGRVASMIKIVSHIPDRFMSQIARVDSLERLAKPDAEVDETGRFIIHNAQTGVVYHYTTNGDTPTYLSSLWTAPFVQLQNPLPRALTVKAFPIRAFASAAVNISVRSDAIAPDVAAQPDSSPLPIARTSSERQDSPSIPPPSPQAPAPAASSSGPPPQERQRRPLPGEVNIDDLPPPPPPPANPPATTSGGDAGESQSAKRDEADPLGSEPAERADPSPSTTAANEPVKDTSATAQDDGAKPAESSAAKPADDRRRQLRRQTTTVVIPRPFKPGGGVKEDADAPSNNVSFSFRMGPTTLPCPPKDGSTPRLGEFAPIEWTATIPPAEQANAQQRRAHSLTYMTKPRMQGHIIRCEFEMPVKVHTVELSTSGEGKAPGRFRFTISPLDGPDKGIVKGQLNDIQEIQCVDLPEERNTVINALRLEFYPPAIARSDPDFQQQLRDIRVIGIIPD